MPYDFLKLVWAALLASWFLAELSDALTFMEAPVIFGSGLYVARRDRAAARRDKPMG
ncbi:MAG: hypothetical protein MK098_14315 [Marinovum sp.]|nr:hypothetical protein [Marinovum sp.]